MNVSSSFLNPILSATFIEDLFSGLIREINFLYLKSLKDEKKSLIYALKIPLLFIKKS